MPVIGMSGRRKRCQPPWLTMAYPGSKISRWTRSVTVRKLILAKPAARPIQEAMTEFSPGRIFLLWFSLLGWDGAAEQFGLSSEVVIGHAGDEITDDTGGGGLGKSLRVNIMGKVANDP